MHEPTTYEIVLQGRPGDRLLRPLLDDFAFDVDTDGRLRLTGVVRDASHLHGIIAHLTSVNVEIVRLATQPTEIPDHPTERSTS